VRTNIEAQENFGDKFLTLLNTEGKDLSVDDVVNFAMNLLVAVVRGAGLPIGDDLLIGLQKLNAAAVAAKGDQK